MDNVKVGQVWIDNDYRTSGRRCVCVNQINGDKALCAVGTYDPSTKTPVAWTSRQTTISLRRFKPTATGYRLVKE